MYSSMISASVVNQSTVDKDTLFCELTSVDGSWAFTTMELYPVNYWYGYNVDGFGQACYNEWDLFWFQRNLERWSVI